MANPQLEDGHTRIANEILDHLVQLHLSPNQWQVLFFVIRKTYGYQKKSDQITNSQIVHATGIGKTHVSRAMSNLVRRRILVRNGKVVGFQKDYESWLEVPELVTKVTRIGNDNPGESYQNGQQKLPKLVTEVPELVTKVTSSLDTQKKKENIQNKKERYGEFKNVLLTDEEYQKLKDRFGEQEIKAVIEKLSSYMESKGTRYKSHYATILNWQRRNNVASKASGRRLPKVYTPTADYPDL